MNTKRLPKLREKKLQTNQAMKDIYERAAKRLETTPELVQEFWEAYNYCLAKIQIREAGYYSTKKKIDWRKNQDPILNIKWFSIGHLRFYDTIIRKESTKYFDLEKVKKSKKGKKF